jgi:hypothetical protein
MIRLNSVHTLSVKLHNRSSNHFKPSTTGGKSILSERSSYAVRRAIVTGTLLATLALPFAAASAQATLHELASSSSEASLTLPDAPGFSSSPMLLTGAPTGSGASSNGASLPEASRTTKYIEPGQSAPKLAAGDKVLLGLRDAVSPFSAVGWLASAGYEQLVNGSPNYGTDRGAFGQRLGAAAIRDISEGIFSDSVMSPLLREDPRYYRMGPSHNFFVRLVYSGTRPIITRTDGGSTTPNIAELAGNLAGAGLTNAYYPQLNRGGKQTLETFGGSLGGAAIGDVVSEFYGDFIHLFHHDTH